MAEFGQFVEVFGFTVIAASVPSAEGWIKGSYISDSIFPKVVSACSRKPKTMDLEKSLSSSSSMSRI